MPCNATAGFVIMSVAASPESHRDKFGTAFIVRNEYRVGVQAVAIPIPLWDTAADVIDQIRVKLSHSGHDTAHPSGSGSASTGDSGLSVRTSKPQDHTGLA